MKTYQYLEGYTSIILKIETIIDLRLEENNKKIATLNMQLQGLLKGKGYEMNNFNGLFDDTCEFADYLYGMYQSKHTLEWKLLDLKKYVGNEFGTNEDFETGKLAAICIIEESVKNSIKNLNKVPDSKKKEYQKVIKGAEILLKCLKSKEIDVTE